MKIFSFLLATGIVARSEKNCHNNAIQTCFDCIDHCLEDKIDQKQCKKLGFNSKKQICKKVCNKSRKPLTCDDCKDIGRKCLKKTKMTNQCTG